MNIDNSKRERRINKIKSLYDDNPYFQDVKKLYLNGEIKTISQVKSTLNKYKTKLDGKPFKKSKEKIELALEKISDDKYYKKVDDFIKGKIKDIPKTQMNKKRYRYLFNKVSNSNKKMVLETERTDGTTRFITVNKENAKKFEISDYDKPADIEDSYKQNEKNKTSSFSASGSGIGSGSRPSGAFFKYTHNIKNLDLTEFQIYNDMEQLKNDRNINCLLQALMTYGLEVVKIAYAKTFIKTRDFPLCKLNELCNKLNIHISIRNVNDNKNTRHFGDKTLEEIKIGLIDEHYFYIKETNITSYALENYNDIKHLENFNNIFRKEGNKYKRKNDRYISSYDVIKILIKNKDQLLTPITKCDELYSTPYYDKIDDIKTLNYINNNLKLNIKKSNEQLEKENKINNNTVNIFADFETITITTDNKHKPYMVYCSGINKIFLGLDCGLQMLKYLTSVYKGKNLRLFFHNAGYDIRFLFEYLQQPKLIERGKFLLRGYGKWYTKKGKSINIEIQDTYAMIPKKLADFGKMFNMKIKKEILPYDLYTEENINKKYIDTDICIKECKRQYVKNNIGNIINKDDEKKYIDEYLNNAIEWECLKDNKIDIIKYSAIYCGMDVRVLEEGYNKFKKWMLDITGLNIDNYISLPSLANQYMTEEGCYDDIYQLSGIPREFIQKCMVGGRTMINKNIKRKINNLVADYDAVNLYGSSIERLSYELGGYLKGSPKILNELNYDFLKNQDGYFVEIKIKEVNKHYKFPLMSYVNDDGIRIFTNDMINKNIFVDKVSLEDLIQFHKIEFEIIRGYYFNEGRNNKCGEVIRYLFNQRLEAKKNKNPIQEVFKLLINSAYGKTLLKPIEEETVYKTVDEFHNYITLNYNWIKYAELLPDNKTYKIKQYKKIDDHFNNCHLGIEVLSMSKRIMNEVMTLAEDNNLNMHYQDTDSIHIDYNQVEKLKEVYYNKYKRKLDGKDMGQFHIDFQSDKIKGDIVSNRSIYLGKKCYIDELIDINDNKNIDYHIRLKGVPMQSILYYCYENNITPFELYEEMYNGKEITFDLTCGGLKCNFEYHYNMTISTKKEFERKIKF